MFTLVAWGKSQAAGAVLAELDALADPHVRCEGRNIIVPSLNKLLGAMAVGANISNARLASPSLRAIAELTINPLNKAAEPLSPPAYVDIFDRPIELVTGEALTAKTSNPAAAAEQHFVLAWLGDGPVTKYVGKFYTVRATSSTTLTPNQWTNVPITLEQTLPAGKYQIVGFAALSAGMVAARLVIPGFPWRPGVPGCDDLADIQAYRFRFGNAGIFGEFDSTSPPTVDCLSISADTTEEFYFDLVKIA